MTPHFTVRPAANDDDYLTPQELERRTAWVFRCSDRLLAAWPELSGTDTDDMACDLVDEHGLDMDPLEVADACVQRYTPAEPGAALTQGGDLQ